MEVNTRGNDVNYNCNIFSFFLLIETEPYILYKNAIKNHFRNVPINLLQVYIPFLSLLQLSEFFRGYIKNTRLALNSSKNILTKDVLFISH